MSLSATRRLTLVAACVVILASAAAAAPPAERLAVGIGIGGGSVSSTPRGIRCGVFCGAAFPRGTTVVLVAHPDRYWLFQRWSGACTGSVPRCTVSLAGAGVAVAIFAPKPGHGDEVSKERPILDVGVGTGGRVRSSPSGIDCSHEDISCYKALRTGTQVTLVATPARGSSFAGWQGAPGIGESCGSRPQCVLTLNFSVHIEASFRSGA